MPEKDIDTINRQQQRRKRINRIKNGIIITIASWMLISIATIIILVVQVVGLNQKYKKINAMVTSLDTSETENTEQNDKYANVVTGIDTEDNMYQEGDQRKGFLTFDCIPNENTNVILDALKELNVKATFFVTGDDSEEAKAIYRRIVNEGHTLGMLSYSNSYSKIYSSTDSFLEDMQKLQDYLREVTGVTCKYYRFLGGSFNEISDLNMAEFVHVLNENQIVYYDWNVNAGDTGANYTVDDVVMNVTQGVSHYKNSVIRLHDSDHNQKTTEAITTLVNALKEADVDVLPIDESTYKVQYIKADSVD